MVTKTKQTAHKATGLLVRSTKKAHQTAKKLPNTKVYKTTKHIARKSATVVTKPARRVARTRVYKTTKRATKATHRVVAQQPHAKLMARFPRYNKWHSWQYKRLNHNHVHLTATISGVFAMAILLSNSLGSVYALSTWTQTDWSGGVGTNTTNQYSANSSIDTTTANQHSLEGIPSYWP